MATPVRVSELEIVGYANVLPKSMLPSIVPPVFRLREEPNHFFLPPYSFKSNFLCDAAEVLEPEIQALRRDRDITLFDNLVIPAQSEFELFVDQEFQHHYLPREKANGWLAAVAERSNEEAKAALRLGNLDEADRLAGVALCADDRKVTPLAIKGAIRLARGDKAGLRLMTSIALHAISESDFMVLVESYAKPVAAPLQMLERKRSAMQNMASYELAA